MSEQPELPDRELRRAAVVGDGGWGTALSLLLDQIGHRVTLWSVDPNYAGQMRGCRRNPRFLPDIDIPDSIEITSDLEQCASGAEIVVTAVPTVYQRGVCRRLAPHLCPEQLVVNVSKGLEEETLLTGMGIVRDVCGEGLRLGGLYGPSHAEEVARGMPTTVVATGPKEVARQIQEAFFGPMFRVYTNADVVGVELGAALKNVIAIAAGVCDGLEFGDNAKSALLTRGLAEMRRLGVAMGGRARTFAGLTGLGDLITTCVSPHGRNRSVGLRLGRGETLEEIMGEMQKVAEGVRTTRSACRLAERHGVEMPITREVHELLFEDKDPMQAGRDLMTRPPRSELDEPV